MKTLHLELDEQDAGVRLDRCLSRLVRDLSRVTLQRLIRSGRVAADGEILDSPKMPMRAGMCLEVALDEPEEPVLAVAEFSFPVIYEDESMLVINKPAGVVVHPAPGNPDGTVVNALLGRYPQLAREQSIAGLRPGIVHRLDKDTSGCLVIALTAQAQFKLAGSFADRQVHKTYLALVRGVPAQKSGECVTLIGRHPRHRQKMAVVARNGKEAVSRYEVVRSGVLDGDAVSLVAVNIVTGRTHQIRVHMAHLGHPVLGDPLYGKKGGPGDFGRQLLHAWKIRLPHPVTGVECNFTAEAPDDFRGALRRMLALSE